MTAPERIYQIALTREDGEALAFGAMLWRNIKPDVEAVLRNNPRATEHVHRFMAALDAIAEQLSAQTQEVGE